MTSLKDLVRNFVYLLAAAMGGLLLYLGYTNRLSNEFLLPLLAILGVICLILVLILAAILFAKTGMADKTQALALPEGSVRAVIALSLIVLFAIITIFLYGSLINGELKRITMPDYKSAKALSESASQPGSSIEVVFIDPPLEQQVEAEEGKASLPPTTDLSSLTTDSAQGKESHFVSSVGPFEIGYRARPNAAAEDFAKQLMTLLGTLMTSVSAFYFGARTVATGAGSVRSPRIASVVPSQLGSGTKGAQITIVGGDLDGTKSVHLSNATEPTIDGRILQNGEGAIVCSFDLPKQPGRWELVVTSNLGETIRKPFDVT